MKMNSPKIRFKGYTEDWEQRKLGELVGIYDGVHQTPDYQDSGIMFLSVENIATLKSEKYISEEAFERDYKVYPEKGDILMTRIGDVGTTSVVETAEKVAFYVSLALLKPNGINSYFLSNAMKTNAFQKGLRERTLVTAIPQKINKDEIGKIDIFITNNDEEQKKIGAYFSNLDHLITLHQRKLEQTKTLKKYMLQKMFPQEGQKVPEIRFEGFTGDWEQRKLGDITVKIGSGKTPLGGKSAYVETGIPLIRSQNVNGDKVDFADIVYIDEATDELMTNSRVYTNDVLLNITGASIGRSAVYKGLESANVNQHVCIIRPTEGHQPDFIQLNLSSDNGQKQIDASQAGGGREGLNFQEIGKMQFSFPSLNEQMTIGRYFNSLDHLITLHQREYEKLQELKKFMLQNMFV